MRPPRHRTWSRIAVGAILLVSLYLIGSVALWYYFRCSRAIPGVCWIDIAWPPRFDRVQRAVGAHHLANAQRLWGQGDYAAGLYFGRAALAKCPNDPEIRLFLARCWFAAGRPATAAQLLEDGLTFDTAEQPLAQLLIECYLAEERWNDVLALPQRHLAARGHTSPATATLLYQLAALRATLETAGPEAAAAIVATSPSLEREPAATPLLARIDLARGGVDAALSRLYRALIANASDPDLHNTRIDIALENGRLETARDAAAAFLANCPAQPDAGLRILEVHSSRAGDDLQPWLQACMRYLAQFHGNAEALESLANLAARKGWADLALLLYEDAVATSGRDRNFALCYIGSLVASGAYGQADALWNDLVEQKQASAETAPVLATMIAAGAGREGDAQEQLERLRIATRNDPPRRKRIVGVLRSFGFAQLADRIVVADSAATHS